MQSSSASRIGASAGERGGSPLPVRERAFIQPAVHAHALRDKVPASVIRMSLQLSAAPRDSDGEPPMPSPRPPLSPVPSPRPRTYSGSASYVPSSKAKVLSKVLRLGATVLAMTTLTLFVNTAVHREATERQHRMAAVLSTTPIDFPIDVVFTWVDGSDTTWRREYVRLSQAAGVDGAETEARMPNLLVGQAANGHGEGEKASPNANANADANANANVSTTVGPSPNTNIYGDELYFAIRSVATNMPWVRRLIILAQRPHVPPFLDELRSLAPFPIDVVYHDEAVVPSKHLPTYNSICIESWMDRIEGLSEHFVYFNDDTFAGRTIHPGWLYTRDGRPIYRRSGLSLLLRVFGRLVMWGSQVHNTRTMAGEPFYEPPHVPIPLTKSLLGAARERFPAAVATVCSHPVRTGDDYSVPFLAYNINRTAAVYVDDLPYTHSFSSYGSIPNADEAAHLMCINGIGRLPPPLALTAAASYKRLNDVLFGAIDSSSLVRVKVRTPVSTEATRPVSLSVILQPEDLPTVATALAGNAFDHAVVCITGARSLEARDAFRKACNAMGLHSAEMWTESIDSNDLAWPLQISDALRRILYEGESETDEAARKSIFRQILSVTTPAEEQMVDARISRMYSHVDRLISSVIETKGQISHVRVVRQRHQSKQAKK